MTAIKIIQLASFQSNLGDNANESGLRWLIRTTFPDTEFAFTDWDLVDYSFGRNYTQDDIDFVNSHDLLIIGGGGFFEIIPDATTWTGTRFNIPESLFDKITIPVIFHGIGIHRVRADLSGKDVGDEIDRFRRFYDKLLVHDRVRIAFRTDGSREVLRRTLGNAMADTITVVADAGLYVDIPKSPHTNTIAHPEAGGEGRVIVINFGGDLLDARFPPMDSDYTQIAEADRVPHPPDYEQVKLIDHDGFNRFNSAFADLLRQLLVADPALQMVLVPHIYRDIVMGAALLTELGFPYNRRRVTMAPYLNGFSGHDVIFDLYRRADLSIGMRYHANVCPVGLGTPTIGLTTFPMLDGFYREIDCLDRRVLTSGSDAMTRIHDLTTTTLANPEDVRARYGKVRACMLERSRAFIREAGALLSL